MIIKLEDIGFYTLEDDRAKNVSLTSSLWRCELLITSKCNFKCSYCRGTSTEADITLDQAKYIVDKWTNENLQNIRFSGGEPTIIKWLPEIIKYSKEKGIKRIAISTNGSSDIDIYDKLLDSGVNDFSISLDACCSSIGDEMTGTNKKGVWDKIVNNIKYLSSKTYVTVGVVLTKKTYSDINDIVKFASDELNVADIRIISAAQWNGLLDNIEIDSNILNKHPILKYRWNNIKKNRNVRGINKCDNKKCPLIIDDMAVVGNKHYPCIIHLREGGNYIGEVNNSIREDRYNYYLNTDVSKDSICKQNCLDVCVDYNNKVKEFKGG